jgi:hypothetical protein
VFWILLELGCSGTGLAAKRHKRHKEEGENEDGKERVEDNGKSAPRTFQSRFISLRFLRFFAAKKSAIGNRQLIRASLPWRLQDAMVLR